MKKKVLNKKRVFYTLVILILIGLFGVTAYKVAEDMGSNDKEKQVKQTMDEISPYGYKLDDRDTSTYKKYFKQLKKVLKQDTIDEEAYAKLLTKLFIVDFYTLDNKLASTDIGGLEFIHKKLVENFKLNAGETMYKHVESDLYGERKQELPIVKAVKIEKIEKTTYTYKKQDYEAYEVTALWNYKKDLGYDTNATFILIKDNDKLNVVEEKKIEETTKNQEETKEESN